MRAQRDWIELEEPFRRVVFSASIDEVADAIPADRATVYRLLNGETRNPSRAVRAGVERVIRDAEGEQE